MTAEKWQQTGRIVHRKKDTAQVRFRGVTNEQDTVTVEVVRTPNSIETHHLSISSSEPLTSRHLRFIPVESLRREAARLAFGKESEKAKKAAERHIADLKPYSDDHLILVAQLFTQARALGGSGVAAVADACDVPEYTASRYVRRAREQAARLGIEPLGTEDHSTATRRAIEKTAGRKDSNGK